MDIPQIEVDTASVHVELEPSPAPIAEVDTPAPEPELTLAGLPAVTQQLLAQERARLASEASAASAVKPERRPWRLNPPFTAEWADQLRIHAQEAGWPAVELTHKTVGGSAEAWAAYFEALRTAGPNLGERQQLERRFRYVEACLWAAQDGEPMPADPDVQPESHMYASPERIQGLGES